MYLINKTGIILLLFFAMLLAGGCASSGAGNAENAGVSADDAVIARDVRDAIQSHSELQDQGIVISSVGGVVTLIGVVESSIERTKALRVAEGVAGVVSVKNELTTP